MKLYSIAVIALSIVLIMLVSYYAGLHNAKVAQVGSDTETIINTTVPVRTNIIREQLPAHIDTVWVDNVSHEVATYSTTIDTNKVHIDLEVKYDEHTNLFNTKHTIIALRDSVYKEKIVERLIEKKPRFIALSSGMSVDFGEAGINSAGIDAGVLLRGQYQLNAFVTTEKLYGVRVGIVW